MKEFCNNPFFGIALSTAGYWIGSVLQKKTRITIFNPLFTAPLMIIVFLLIFKIPYEYYNLGGSLIGMFLVPATACLGVSIYSRFDLLKKNWLPILAGCAAGSAASMTSVWGLCRLFRLDDSLANSLVPKSVTTPIAMDISAGNGGIVPVTVAAVVFTGVVGSLISPALVKFFRLKNPLIVGLSIGASSHVGGTTKALEMGEAEGSMSGLAIGLCGIITVCLAIVFYRITGLISIP
ncbi:MAG: LrgB family protein [Treponema sp.]|jgi:predicted murein hydrolase (TIGR00659 family)|nr:LrgB family protein [Treponema sp.]